MQSEPHCKLDRMLLPEFVATVRKSIQTDHDPSTRIYCGGLDVCDFDAVRESLWHECGHARIAIHHGHTFVTIGVFDGINLACAFDGSRDPGIDFDIALAGLVAQYLSGHRTIDCNAMLEFWLASPDGATDRHQADIFANQLGKSARELASHRIPEIAQIIEYSRQHIEDLIQKVLLPRMPQTYATPHEVHDYLTPLSESHSN